MTYAGTVKPRLHQIAQYNLRWPETAHPVHIEMGMIEKGGRWKKKDGTFAGEGLAFHYKALMKLLWPEIVWHDWAEMQLDSYLEYRIIAQMGPASCVAGDTPIYDPITGESPTIRYLCENGIAPVVQTLWGPCRAGIPFLKGVDRLYLVESADGKSFKATADHLVLSEDGFVPVGSLRCGRRLLSVSPDLEESTSLVPVSKITLLGKDSFYDLVVPIHHHYLANGFIHHNTGKSFVPAACVLADYYCFPYSTTVLVSSTTRESLEMRVWGEIKKLHKLAKGRADWLPGYLIEGRQRIVTDPRSEASEGRDFRNGLVGVACKRGQTFQGIEEYVGIKNKRLRMIADELQFMPRQFVDSIANMNKNTDFKCVGSGNPKDTTDALGVLCEPAAHLGGWDGGIDQTPKTKTWPIRFPKGICLQLCGADSPNLDGRLGIPLITQEQIETDIKFYGRDSIQFTMMDMGMMPRGLGNRRVITRSLCLKFGALEEPLWMNNLRTRVGFLDAAYKGVGGDRNVFGELQFGINSEGKNIIALIDTLVLSIKDTIAEMPEDQVAIQVKEQCELRNIPPNHVFFDSTGRGTLMSSFARLWSNQVVPVEFGGPPTDRPVANGIDMTCRDYYFNFVSELWYSVRLVIESGQFRGLTEDVMAEGCLREWTKVGANKIQVEPKEKMKLKSGRSPDLFDGLAAGIEGARRLGFVVENVGQERRSREVDAWHRELRDRAHNLWQDHTLSYR